MKNKNQYVETRGERRTLAVWLSLNQIALMAEQLAIAAERGADESTVAEILSYVCGQAFRAMQEIRRCPDDREICESDWHPDRYGRLWRPEDSRMANQIRDLYSTSILRIRIAKPFAVGLRSPCFIPERGPSVFAGIVGDMESLRIIRDRGRSET